MILKEKIRKTLHRDPWLDRKEQTEYWREYSYARGEDERGWQCFSTDCRLVPQQL